MNKLTALQEISRERDRQIAKGYDQRHDDEHTDGAISAAAAYYAWGKGAPNYLWPWGEATLPTVSLMTDRARLLTAAALCVAEIERLDRVSGRLVSDWEDVEQRTNVGAWCDACQSTHWSGQCDPDLDEQRMPR